MTEKRLLLLGARSDMGQAIARRFAQDGFNLQLAARDTGTIEAFAKDTALRHNVDVSCYVLDVTELEASARFFKALPEPPTLVVCVVGWMGLQDEVAENAGLVTRTVASNLTGPAWMLEEAARILAAQKADTGIIGVSSVAGDRGRATNYWYGASKAGFSVFLSGLRQKYAATKVHVMTVKPGFVATRMTEGMDLPAKLTAQPDEIAEGIYKGWTRRRNTLYLKPLWWVIMTIITTLPESIFKRTKF